MDLLSISARISCIDEEIIHLGFVVINKGPNGWTYLSDSRPGSPDFIQDLEEMGITHSDKFYDAFAPGGVLKTKGAHWSKDQVLDFLKSLSKKLSLYIYYCCIIQESSYFIGMFIRIFFIDIL